MLIFSSGRIIVRRADWPVPLELWGHSPATTTTTTTTETLHSYSTIGQRVAQSLYQASERHTHTHTIQFNTQAQRRIRASEHTDRVADHYRLRFIAPAFGHFC